MLTTPEFEGNYIPGGRVDGRGVETYPLLSKEKSIKFVTIMIIKVFLLLTQSSHLCQHPQGTQLPAHHGIEGKPRGEPG